MQNKKHVYIIAEAGQNHNGSMDLAKKLIDMAAMPIFDKFNNIELPGVDAIKFTKRDLSEELTKEAANKIYDSPNAFGKTYGEHREKLELSYDQHIQLFNYATEKGLDFIETLTSPKAVKLAEKIKLKYIKVASRDLTNIPLLNEIGKTGIPVILSTGMGGLKEIDEALDVITKYHENIVLLHCISQYPAEYENLNLRSIKFMKDRYPFPVGYSDHSIGIVAPAVALALGAEFIEKHITISHTLKGSDHRSALEPEGLWRMVRDIRNMEKALGDFKKEINSDVEKFRIKLERSLCTKRKIAKGERITEDDLIMLSPGGGMSWKEKEKILGKIAKQEIDEYSL
ncbi:MAG: shikimate dehydrogenase, partial [Ignavibacteria bacterium]